MATRVVLNRAELARLLRSDEIGDGIESAQGEAVLAAAKASAPVLTGTYRDGLHIERVVGETVEIRIAGGTDYDVFVEADTGNLARSLDAAR